MTLGLRQTKCTCLAMAYDEGVPRARKPASPFRYFNSSPDGIRLVMLMYVRFPLSFRNVEDLLCERGIDICHETVRLWWNRFGPLLAGDIRRQRVSRMRGFRHWRWHLDEVYVKLNGEMVYLWRTVDHEGEVLESYVTMSRDKAAALSFMKKALRRHGSPEPITTDGLRSYRAAMNDLSNAEKQEVGRWTNNRVENSHLPSRRRERAMLPVPADEDAAEVRLCPRQCPQSLEP
jgi:putative transposase